MNRSRRARRRIATIVGATVALALTAIVPAVASEGATPAWLGDVPGLGDKAPDMAPSNLRGCTISNPMFKLPASDVRRGGFVPAKYRLGTNAYFGPGAATVMAAVLVCDQGSAGRTPMIVSLLAVQIEADSNDDTPADAAWSAYNQSTLNFLPSSSWYLLEAHTNAPGVFKAFRRAGLPVRKVSFRRSTDYGGALNTDSLSFGSAADQYRLVTSTALADPFVHNHDWLFRYDNPDNGRSTGFVLHLHAMADSSCGYHASPVVATTTAGCGTTIDIPESDALMCRLLGSRRTTPYAFNHPTSHNSGSITYPFS